MRWNNLFGLTLVVVGTAWGAPRPKEVASKDPDVAGRWTLVSLSQGGESVPLGAMAVDTEFTADGRRLCRNRLGQMVGETRYVLDRAKNPPTLDLRSATDDAVTALGVYMVDGDTLTVCYETGSGASRPEKLEAPSGSNVQMAVYRRVKPD